VGNGEWGVGTSTGFSLIELLIATTVTILIAGAIAGVAPHARAAFDRCACRSRSAAAWPNRDRCTVAGNSLGRNERRCDAIRLERSATVLPTVSLSGGDDPGVFTELTVILPVPDAAQATLETDQPAPGGAMTLAAAPCPNTKDVCGFTPGSTTLVADGKGTSTSSRGGNNFSHSPVDTRPPAFSVLSGGIGARRSGSIRLQPPGAARWQLFAGPQDSCGRSPASSRFREWSGFSSRPPERCRRLRSGRAG
jgi:hypothetical protein